MIPTPRLWVTIAVLSLPAMAAGFIPGLWNILLFLDIALVLLAAADWMLARRYPLEARRELPARLSVGVSNKLFLHVINRAPRPLRIRVKDDVPEEFEVEPAIVDLTLSKESRAKVVYRATPQKRGRFAFGDLNLRIKGPFGLVWQERTIPAKDQVAVYPDMRGASRLLLSGAAMDLVNLGLRQLRRDGRGSEFARLRDYTQGDSVRDVDWKATARRNKPVTRVMESERSQSVLICVDAGRSMAAKVDGLTKLDHAVNAALFLAFVAIRNGDRVGLAVFADGVKAFLQPDAGRKQYRKIVDTLFSAKPELTYVDYLALFKELSVRVRRRSLLCVFTDLLDEEQASSMVFPVRRLARRHVPLCLTVKDTALEELLRTPPPGPEEAFQHAVACELLADREQMKARVAQDGVHVIDVHPEELSLAAVNRYLEIKARGTL
ncbi:MAG: DUF58 domain-containing protein [Myxococcaceae bacterium]|nr:DUF58 domain-containing protein [Myxococcaceae bacterium]